MGVLTRALEKIGVIKRATAAGVVVQPYDPLWPLAGFGSKNYKFDTDKPFSQHAYVHACIDAIAGRISSLTYDVLTGTTQRTQKIEEGDLYSVLARPNPEVNAQYLWYLTVAHLMASGNAFWVLERNRPTDVPSRIWPFGRDRFEPIWDTSERTLLGWQFTQTNGKGSVRKIPLKTFQVVWYAIPNPEEEFWGVGPLEACRKSVEADWLAALFNLDYFSNGAQPGMILKYTLGRLAPVQREQIENRFNAKFVGTGTHFRTIVLDGEYEVVPVPISYKDMQFLQLHAKSKQEIATCFRVPLSLVGEADTQYKATAQEVAKGFWEGTLKPIIRLLEDCMRAQFWLPYDDEETWGAFDLSAVEALQVDRDAKWGRVKNAFSCGVPFSIANAIEGLGYPPFDGWDKSYLPMGVVAAGEPLPSLIPSSPKTPNTLPAPAPPPTNEPVPLPSAEKPSAKLIETPKRLYISTSKTRGILEFGSPEATEVSIEHIQRTAKQEKAYSQKLRSWFQRLKAFFAASLVTAGDSYPSVGDIPESILALPEAYSEDLMAMSAEHYVKVVNAISAEITQSVHVVDPSFTFDPAAQSIKDFIAQKTIKVKEEVVGSLSERVREALLKGQDENMTVSELAQEISGAVGDNKSRALTIARTETGQCISGVQAQAFDEAGIKTIQWIACVDEKTRKTHLHNMELGEWKYGDVYPNGCRWPSDINGEAREVCNCRCSWSAIS